MAGDRSLSHGGQATLFADGRKPGERPAGPGVVAAAAGTGQPADAVTVREVAWHHLAAVALRESLAAEMLYSGRPQSLTSGPRWAASPADSGGAVAYTGVAFTQEGLPVGHAALRWNDDDIELQRVYVTPRHQGSGTAAALLAAAEEAARALHVRRIILRPSDQQPGDAAIWERAGYTRITSVPPCQSAHGSQCFEKVIAGDPPISLE